MPPPPMAAALSSPLSEDDTQGGPTAEAATAKVPTAEAATAEAAKGGDDFRGSSRGRQLLPSAER